jgi:hypothetical protein
MSRPAEAHMKMLLDVPKYAAVQDGYHAGATQAHRQLWCALVVAQIACAADMLRCKPAALLFVLLHQLCKWVITALWYTMPRYPCC